MITENKIETEVFGPEKEKKSLRSVVNREIQRPALNKPSLFGVHWFNFNNKTLIASFAIICSSVILEILSTAPLVASFFAADALRIVGGIGVLGAILFVCSFDVGPFICSKCGKTLSDRGAIRKNIKNKAWMLCLNCSSPDWVLVTNG
jgi:hypothetical protein